MEENLKLLIEAANAILITSHIGPDADSLCSSLVLEATLKENYNDKKIVVCMEEEYNPLAFLVGYESIQFGILSDNFNKHQPDLLIILDASNLARCSREPESARSYIDEQGAKIAVIDHHEPIEVEPGAVYINQASPAVTQDICEICFDQWKLRKPEAYAQTAMVGLYSDTGGFTYDNPRYKDTFKLAASLIADGASPELAANQLTQYSKDGLAVLNELIKNLNQTKDCTYSYISDEFYSAWQRDGRPADAIHEGFDIFLHNFIRNVEGRFWGFTVYPDPKAKEKTYSVSFRSLQGRVDVSALARQLGGGGHKPAAGAKIKAESVGAALEAVKTVVENRAP